MNSGKFTFLRGHLLLYYTMEITTHAHSHTHAHVHTHVCSKLCGFKPTKEPEVQTVLPLSQIHTAEEGERPVRQAVFRPPHMHPHVNDYVLFLKSLRGPGKGLKGRDRGGLDQSTLQPCIKSANSYREWEPWVALTRSPARQQRRPLNSELQRLSGSSVL